MPEIPWEHPLVSLALVHPSYAYENGLPEDNQRLEFLGDAVLGLVFGGAVFSLHADWDEGRMTRLRARLAKRESLAHLAGTLGLHERVLVGRGERGSGGPLRPRILADAFEALIGALFLIQGYDHVRSLVLQVADSFLAQAVPEGDRPDAKSHLQELLQSRGMAPVYEIKESTGPAHDRWYLVVAKVGESALGEGEGPSKKIAETRAAEAALLKLRAASPELGPDLQKG